MVEAGDMLEHLLLGRMVRQMKLERLDAHGVRGLLLVADIGGGVLSVSDKDDSEAGNGTQGVSHGGDLEAYLIPHFLCHGFPIYELSRSRSRRGSWAGRAFIIHQEGNTELRIVKY